MTKTLEQIDNAIDLAMSTAEALSALLKAANLTEAQLLALANGTAVVVPVKITRTMTDDGASAYIDAARQGVLPAMTVAYAAMLKARPQ